MGQPNVLLVIADQHLATCTGYEGHPQALTPNLDRLAREGARFTGAYTQNPICTPSRVSLLSGQYCHNHGYYGLGGSSPDWLPNFLRHFRAHGYRTALIGKLHLPKDPDHWAKADCDWFREAMRPDYPGHPYFDHLRAQGLGGRSDHERLPEFPGDQQFEGRPSWLPYEHSVEGWSVREAMRFMDDAGDRPFCMEVSLFRPHQCYTPARQFWDMYPDDLALPPTLNQDPAHRPPHFREAFAGYRQLSPLIEPKTFDALARRIWRGYLASITHCDYALGELLAYLDRTGKAVNTLVIYTADHGAYSGTHGLAEKAPGICSEAVCRVPLLWRGPGVARGHVVRPFGELVDLGPTAASACGLPAMDWVDGRDLTGLLRGGDQPVREVAVTENPWSKSLRWQQWRYVHYQQEMFGGEDVGELYDIVADPNETRNLYADPAHQPVVQECRRRLLNWLIQTTRFVNAWVPPFWPKLDQNAGGDSKEANTPGIPGRFNTNINYI
jgi:choline-sulfatase/uncharacterized sulfatase